MRRQPTLESTRDGDRVMVQPDSPCPSPREKPQTHLLSPYYGPVLTHRDICAYRCISVCMHTCGYAWTFIHTDIYIYINPETDPYKHIYNRGIAINAMEAYMYISLCTDLGCVETYLWTHAYNIYICGYMHIHMHI